MNIWTNGCFDVLHIGHIELFRYAKSLGNTLTVGIDSDARVKTLKGPKRPINNAIFRQSFLESIRYIDKVVVFDTDTELEFYIRQIPIDIIVVGDDYKNKKVIGSEYVSGIHFFSKIPNISTSAILNG